VTSTAPLATESARLHALDQITLAVSNLDAATGQIARLLGRRPSWRGEHPQAGTENALFRLENTTLELLCPSGDAAFARGLRDWIAANGEGLLGIAFATADASACRARLAAAGLEPGAVEKNLGRDVDSGAYRQWLRVGLPFARTRGIPIALIEHKSPPELLPPATAFAPEASTAYALDHLVVLSGAPEASRVLFGEQLGLRLALDRAFPAWGSRLLFFRVGKLTLELAARLSDEGARAAGSAALPPPPSASTDRLFGLSWRVRDTAAARERLAALDFEVSELREGRKPGTRVFTVRSHTCGVATLVLEAPPPKPKPVDPDED
jgi:catechol 2,3-dioxygenase-like lactoylglutathione lyase family enzyme